MVPLSILIADDHVIIRRGLRNLLKDHLSVRFMEEAGSIAELMRALKGATPDLLVLDLQLGDGHALDVLEQIRCSHPEMRVLVYTMSPEHIYAPRVLALGGAGFLSKRSTEEEVLGGASRHAGQGVPQPRTGAAPNGALRTGASGRRFQPLSGPFRSRVGGDERIAAGRHGEGDRRATGPSTHHGGHLTGPVDRQARVFKPVGPAMHRGPAWPPPQLSAGWP